MASYDSKAILGAQLQTLATDIAVDIRLRTRGWNVTLFNGNALAIKWPANKYISRTSFLVLMANQNCGYDVIALGMRQNSPSGSTPGTCPTPKMQVISYSDDNVPEFWYNNTDATERTIYLKFPTMGAAHPVSVIAATDTFSEFTVGSIAGSSVTGDIATDGTSGVTYVSKGGFVDVSGYTSYNAILAVANSGRIPYYPYTDSSNNGTVNLYYAGSYGIPNVGMVHYFEAVIGETLYHNSFPAASSAFTAVRKMPLFDADRVLGSSDASSWSGDNTNVPTRAAVEAKISNAMSGNIGGYIGNFAPQSVLTYQNRIPFKNGDWISMGSSGTAYYYPNNDDTQTLASISVNSGDSIYWTVDGDFVIKPSNAVQVFTESGLSDWNTLTNTGLYQIASQASGVSNSPGSGQFSCLVSDANGKITQVATGGGSIFYRFKSSGQWSSWRDVKDADTAVSANITKTLDAELGDYLQIGSGQGVNVSCSAWAKTAGTAGRAVADNEGNELGVTYQQKKQVPAIGPKWQTQGQTVDHTDDSRVGSIVTVAWRADSSYTDIRQIIPDTVSEPFRTNDNGRIYAIFNMASSDRTITYLMGGAYSLLVPAGKFVFILKFENNYWPYKD